MAGQLNVFKNITANVTNTLSTVYTTPLGYSTVVLLSQISNNSNATIQISAGTSNAGSYTALVSNAAVPAADAIGVIGGRLILPYGSSFQVGASANGVSQLTLSLLETLV
jgi:hypothetical protein